MLGVEMLGYQLKLCGWVSKQVLYKRNQVGTISWVPYPHFFVTLKIRVETIFWCTYLNTPKRWVTKKCG